MTSYRLAVGADGALRARGIPSHPTDTANDPHEAPTPWPLGAVVAFRRRSSTGFGQVESVALNGRVRIRTWLPCRTRTLELDPANIRLVATLDDLHDALHRWR